MITIKTKRVELNKFLVLIRHFKVEFTEPHERSATDFESCIKRIREKVEYLYKKNSKVLKNQTFNILMERIGDSPNEVESQIDDILIRMVTQS